MPDRPDPHLFTCVGVAYDLPLLPHFIRHYVALGVAPDRMHIILNSAEADDPNIEAAREIADSFGVRHVETWIEPYTSDRMWEKRREMQARHATSADWVINADVDEFHEYPLPLHEFLTACDAMGVNAVSGVFIDRLTADGRLVDVAPAPTIFEQFPIRAEVTYSLFGSGEFHGLGGTMKLMAMRGMIMPRRGGHGPMHHPNIVHLYGEKLDEFVFLMQPAQRFRVPTRAHHVHWTASLRDRLQKRLDTPGASRAGSEYGRKQLDHIARHGGIDITQIAVETDDARPDWRAEVRRFRRWNWYLRKRKKVVEFVGR
ncbi:MAG: glycosyltransferase family 2 protein [Pseudomonadota bacterium]